MYIGWVEPQPPSLSWSLDLISKPTKLTNVYRVGGGGGGGVYLESYTREARVLTRWDQHAVAQQRETETVRERAVSAAGCAYPKSPVKEQH